MSEAQTVVTPEVTIDEIVVSAELKNIIETLIFASDEPMTPRFIRSIMDEVNKDLQPSEQYVVNAEIIRKAVGDLNRGYGRLGTGFRIIEVAGGFVHATQEEFSMWVGKLAKERARRRLSPTAVETLAIIAYKQPIAKGELEFIRGVNVDYIINALLEKDLIHITGRASTPGRPLLYGTTQKFLEHFGLNELTDLPKPREISELISETELEVDRRLLAEQQELEFKQDLENKLEGNEGSKNKPQKASKVKVPDDVKSENRRKEKTISAEDQGPVLVGDKQADEVHIGEGESSSENNLTTDEAAAHLQDVLQNEAAVSENGAVIPKINRVDHLATNDPESEPGSLEHSVIDLATSLQSLDPADSVKDELPENRTIDGNDQPTTVAQQNPQNVLENRENHLTANDQTILTEDAEGHSDLSIGSEHQEQSQPAETEKGWSKWKNKVKTFFQKLFA